jgi:hypothetical protein
MRISISLNDFISSKYLGAYTNKVIDFEQLVPSAAMA